MDLRIHTEFSGAPGCHRCGWPTTLPGTQEDMMVVALMEWAPTRFEPAAAGASERLRRFEEAAPTFVERLSPVGQKAVAG